MAREITEITVEGMSCNHCSNSVKKAVGALQGVHSVAVDLDAKKVTVDFDPGEVTGKAIFDAIEEEGYQVVR